MLLVKSSLLLWCGAKLLKDYMITQHTNTFWQGPYRWWNVTCVVIIVNNLGLFSSAFFSWLFNDFQSFNRFFGSYALSSLSALFLNWLLLYLIWSSYDPMNYNVSLDQFYTTDYPLFLMATTIDYSVVIIAHKPMIEKYYKLKYAKVGQCVIGTTVYECTISPTPN